MTEVPLLHHALGLTPGVRAFADDFWAGGQIAHTPDLFDGRIYTTIEKGLAWIGQIGFDDLRKCGVRIADDLPFESRLRGLFILSFSRTATCTNTSHGARRAALPFLSSGQRRVGLWAMAGERSGENPRHGQSSPFS